MRNNRWLRYGLGSLVVASGALGSFLVACGDDDNGGTTPTPDSGVADTSTPTPDTGAPDTGTPVPPLPNAKLTIVNAAVDLGEGANFQGTNVTAVRICFGVGPQGSITPLPPQPDRSGTPLPPGIPIGFGGAFPSFGLDLEPLAVTPYVMNAQALAAKGVVRQGTNPGPACDEILAPGAVLDGGATFAENVDYWKLPVIPAGTFRKDRSYVLVLSGCTADADQANADDGRCGPGATFADAGAGNLAVKIYEVDRQTQVASSSFGAQFIHASSPVGAAGIPVTPAIGPFDGGAPKLIGDGGVVPFGSGTALSQLDGVSIPSDFVYVVGTPVGQPLVGAGSVQAVSFPNADGGAPLVPPGADFRNGAGFVFIALGDPLQAAMGGPGGTFNGRTLHFLGFPTDPTIQPYQP